MVAPGRRSEPLDILRLTWEEVESGEESDVNLVLYTIGEIRLEPKHTYEVELVFTSSNVVIEPFTFRILWDGTVDGFADAGFLD